MPTSDVSNHSLKIVLAVMSLKISDKLVNMQVHASPVSNSHSLHQHYHQFISLNNSLNLVIYCSFFIRWKNKKRCELSRHINRHEMWKMSKWLCWRWNNLQTRQNVRRSTMLSVSLLLFYTKSFSICIKTRIKSEF